jgi:2,5-diketo-D-gluconate reductase A
MSTKELFYVAKDGYHVPQLGFGLYKVSKPECKNVVCDAILAGYRHFDCAPAYGNEREVGEALSFMIHDGVVSRKDLYICSKVWKDAVVAGRIAVRQSIENSISDLCCEYLDLAMIHWPVQSHVDAYKELELMVKEGKIRSLGLSNYFPEVSMISMIH